MLKDLGRDRPTRQRARLGSLDVDGSCPLTTRLVGTGQKLIIPIVPTYPKLQTIRHMLPKPTRKLHITTTTDRSQAAITSTTLVPMRSTQYVENGKSPEIEH